MTICITFLFLFTCYPALCTNSIFKSLCSKNLKSVCCLACNHFHPITRDLRSVCPSSTSMFQHLYHAIVYWEKLLLDRSPTAGTNQENLVSSIPNKESDCGGSQSSGSSCFASASYLLISPARRMTFPSVHVLEYDTRQVVTLDPVYISHTDLDDISQPENGVAADAEISASDSESEASAKEDQSSEPITETPYVANENEVLGTVSIKFCTA